MQNTFTLKPRLFNSSAQTGNSYGCAVKADLTVALAEYKYGFFLGDGFDFCGKTVKRDIGISVPDGNYIGVCEASDVKKLYPLRKRNTHKGTYGSANIIAGSDKYTGAAILSVEAALRSGCGYVKLTSEEQVKHVSISLQVLLLSASAPNFARAFKPSASIISVPL